MVPEMLYSGEVQYSHLTSVSISCIYDPGSRVYSPPPSPQWYGTWNTYILLYSVVLFCIPSLRSVFWPNLSTGLSGNQIQSNYIKFNWLTLAWVGAHVTHVFHFFREIKQPQAARGLLGFWGQNEALSNVALEPWNPSTLKPCTLAKHRKTSYIALWAWQWEPRNRGTL